LRFNRKSFNLTKCIQFLSGRKAIIYAYAHTLGIHMKRYFFTKLFYFKNVLKIIDIQIDMTIKWR